MDHFRTEVGHRADRLRRRRRRLVGGSTGAAALVVVLAVSLVTVEPLQPGHTVSAPASRPSGPAANSPTNPASPDPDEAGTPAAGSSSASPGNGAPVYGTASACGPDAVCIDADWLGRQGALATASGREGQSDASPEVGTVSLPADRVLEFSLTPTTARAWGTPKVTGGAALKHRATRSGPGRTVTTDFVPVGASGSAVVSVTCRGTGCTDPSYQVDVTVVPKA
jgi:hypothetical protein